MRRAHIFTGMSLVALLACGGCAGHHADPGPVVPDPGTRSAVTTTSPTSARDPELDREAASLRLQVLERDAQIADLRRRLDEAMTEVVRAMARMRTLATRAEAASAIAEAEVALQQLTARLGRDAPADVETARGLLRTASAEFDKENYGGALYLANQAKRAATTAQSRLAEAGGGRQAGETAFAVAVPLQATSRSNVRAGPGTQFDIVATVEAGTPLTGVSHLADWVRVTLGDGRSAWIFAALVQARP